LTVSSSLNVSGAAVNNTGFVLTYNTASGLVSYTSSAGFGGGSGTPGGSDTQIQFNNGGAFGATGSFVFIYTSQSLQQGLNVTTIGQYSHAEGINTQTTGEGSHTEGNATQAIGGGSHAEGQSTTAIGNYSHAEGHITATVGQYSHAEGRNTIALGSHSHTEGSGSIASGSHSHAEGEQTTTIGQSSHAEGYQTTSIGLYSHAEGSDTQAIGNYSHAEGLSTIAIGNYQHVQGQYNLTSLAPSVFIIGNGTSDINRSNLVFASGSQFQITGSLEVSGSARITNVLTLPYQDPLPSSPATGSIALSGSGATFVGMFVWTGTWTQI
jgi:hypothetical protein